MISGDEGLSSLAHAQYRCDPAQLREVFEHHDGRMADEIPLTANGKKLNCRVRAQAREDAAAGLLVRP